MKAIKTYDLIRQLAKLDPDGDMTIMLAIKYTKTARDGNEVVDEAAGFVEGFTVEHWDDGQPGCIVLESTDI